MVHLWQFMIYQYFSWYFPWIIFIDQWMMDDYLEPIFPGNVPRDAGDRCAHEVERTYSARNLEIWNLETPAGQLLDTWRYWSISRENDPPRSLVSNFGTPNFDFHHFSSLFIHLRLGTQRAKPSLRQKTLREAQRKPWEMEDIIVFLVKLFWLNIETMDDIWMF